MKNLHNKIVKTVADELVKMGLSGRADHIGAHPFPFYYPYRLAQSRTIIFKKNFFWGVCLHNNKKR